MGANQTVPQKQQMSKERSCAEALMMACDERLGAQSPAALMVCDTFLARDFWTSFVHQSYLPPAASQVWACGRNDHSQLGIGYGYWRTTPTEVTALHGRCIHAVACGAEHTMAVVDDGELWATGNNIIGQLGLGNGKERCSFTRVSGLSGRKVAAVACGRYHTLALLESGELFAWGDNAFGQLGLGDITNRTTPEPVAGLSGRRVVAVACGAHSVALLEPGKLFAWGWNDRGQLGLGDNADRNEPTQVTALAGRRVVAVACGNKFSAAIVDSGELFTWGDSDCGQLGIGTFNARNSPQLVEAFRDRPVKAVSCGALHAMALLKDGRVFSWGDSAFGKLGIPGTAPLGTPQQVRFFEFNRVRAISCGFSQSAVILDTGELFAWGYNRYHDLGIGDAQPLFWSVPRKVNKRTLFPSSKPNVLCIAFGCNHSIQLIQ